MKHYTIAIVAAATVASPSLAVTAVNWSTISGSVDNVDGTNTASATMDVGGTSVAVTYTGTHAFVRPASSGNNEWNEGDPAPYTGGNYALSDGYHTGEALGSGPTDASMIGLSGASQETITFSQAVSDVYVALLSWNGDGIADFSSPFSLVSSGQGHYGAGYFGDVSDTGFTGVGELHGVIKFAGPIKTLTFNALGGEYYHGLLVGTAALAPPPSAVPEPATWAMMVGGFGIAGSALRRQRRIVRTA